MTLGEIDAALPNGFHDAAVKSLLVDYSKRTLTMSLSVWIGNKDDPGAHRLAEVVVDGLWFLVLDPPHPEYPLGEDEFLTIDCAQDSGPWTIPALLSLPKGFFASRIYVDDWNSCMYIAGRTASIAWKGESYERWPTP